MMSQQNLNPLVEKKQPPINEQTKTIRFNLKLIPPDKGDCPIFNYEELLKSAKIHEKSNEKTNGKLEPFSSNEDESLRQVAERFEEKYGRNGKKKYHTYAELGAGYDESDSFIDNTEACEEILPDYLETKRGGFYVNSGKLEFNQVYDSVPRKYKKDKLNGKERKQDQTNNIVVRKKKKLMPEPEKKLQDPTEETPLKTEANNPVKIEDISYIGNTKIEKVEIPAALRNWENSSPPAEPLVKKEAESITVLSPINEQLCDKPTDLSTAKEETDYKNKSVNEVIESVINSAPKELDKERKMETIHNPFSPNDKKVEMALSSKQELHSDVNMPVEPYVNSNSDNSESLDKAYGTKEGASQISETPQPPSLPENLSPQIYQLINELKSTASYVKDSQKRTFFNSHSVNQLLLKLECECRKKLATSGRRNVYSYLSFYLPCSKATLIARAKKLFTGGNGQLEALLSKIKAIAEVPRIKDKLEIDFSKISPGRDEHGAENLKYNSLHSPLSKNITLKDQLKSHLKKIVQIKVRQYVAISKKKETLHTYMIDYFQTTLVPLWPDNRMKLQILFKYCKETIASEAAEYNITYSPDGIITSPNTFLDKISSAKKKCKYPESGDLQKLLVKSSSEISGVNSHTTLDTNLKEENAKKAPLSLIKESKEKPITSKHSTLTSSRTAQLSFSSVKKIVENGNPFQAHQPDKSSKPVLIVPEDDEKRLHEETFEATNVLSKIITEENGQTLGNDDKVQMEVDQVIEDLVHLNQMNSQSNSATKSLSYATQIEPFSNSDRYPAFHIPEEKPFSQPSFYRKY